MPSIGRVRKQDDGSYKGYLATLSIRKNITFEPDKKAKGQQPNFTIMAGDIEVGAAWNKQNQTTGAPYVSCSLAAPEFGDRTIYCNLGRAAGSDDESELALIWNPKE